MRLLNHVSYVPACQRSLRVNVLTCQCSLYANLLACQRGLHANVPAFLRAKSMSTSLFLLANVPIKVPTCNTACQCSNLTCQRGKSRVNFSNISLTKC